MHEPEQEPFAAPLAMVDRLYQELLDHYGPGADAEMRAAAKLLLVALEKFRRHGGPQWQQLLAEYVEMARDEPERFRRILDVQRQPDDLPAE
jgi:hypothetical protein